MQSTPLATEESSSNTELAALTFSILHRWSTLGTGFVSALLALATLQAPLILLSTGGSLEATQTISASVSNWESPEGRLFFGLCSFGAVLNLVTLQSFLLTPPSGRLQNSKVLSGSIYTCTTYLTCSKPDPSPLFWPLGPEGWVRFWWVALQSIGLYLLAAISYPKDVATNPSKAVAIQAKMHNFGAACAFLVSFALELGFLSTFPGRFKGRRFFTALGICFAAAFLVTQSVFSCTGRMPADLCHAPMGTVAYLTEVGMCLSLAMIFFLAANGARAGFIASELVMGPSPPSLIRQAANRQSVRPNGAFDDGHTRSQQQGGRML